MKTAISIPDFLYAEVDRTAAAMNIPRSQLFTKAIEEYLHNHTASSITERLNAVYKNTAEQNSDVSEESGVESLRELTKNDSW